MDKLSIRVKQRDVITQSCPSVNAGLVKVCILAQMQLLIHALIVMWSKKVPSGVLQGWVPGPILFVVYIRDLPDRVAGDSMLHMFADETKQSRAVFDVSYAEILEQNIDNTDEWSYEWLMDFTHWNKRL